MGRITASIVFVLMFSLISADSICQDESVSKLISYRALGPYRAGSWVSAIAVPPGNKPEYKYTWYVAGRNGGVWKTENSGTTFSPVFDHTGVSSIGAIAIAESNPEIVWVGTGEAYNARSSHSGNGVYKSINGGETWENMGLTDSHHISTLIVHPQNPDIVWVASMGHLFTPNQERGVFKTINGGKSWEKVLFIDENTGVIDLILNPENPDVLFAATYEKYRFPWHYEAGGVKSGVYKTNNGGDDWKLMANGLPEGKLGRIGLALCYQNPEFVYAVIENLNPKPGVVIDENIEMSHLRDAYFDQMIGGEVYCSVDNGESWEKRNDAATNVSAKAAYSFNKIMIASDNPDIVYITSDLMQYSEDGGRTWPDLIWPPKILSSTIFGDHRSVWMDPQDGRHIMVGTDGGLYESFDRGKTFTHHVNIPLGEIYNVETDDAYPYNIYVGLQDHEVWKGPSNSWSGKVSADDWVITGMWDGMYTKVDPENNRWLYTTTQFGAHLRVDQKMGERVDIEPKAGEDEPAYRFCWNTPLELSHHNSKILYTGGQMLLKSDNQGNSWSEVSHDLTYNDAEKVAGKGHMMYCTITSISESPLSKDIIWVGTDDGRIWMTNNGGDTWNEFTNAIATLGDDKNLWVSKVLASQYRPGRAYVCKSGYRNDDFRALVYKTEDYGSSWTMITEGLSEAPVNVIIEDLVREGLLYLGSDNGVFYSLNNGGQWNSLQQNMPPAPVKDLKIQERESDLVVGTYGRGAFIADIWPLSHSPQKMSEDMFLFPVQDKPQRNCSERVSWGNYEQTGDNFITTPNSYNGLAIYYFIDISLNDSAWIQVCDSDKYPIDTVHISQTPGYHLDFYNTWDTNPGDYYIRMISGDKILEEKVNVLPSPVWTVGRLTD